MNGQESRLSSKKRVSPPATTGPHRCILRWLAHHFLSLSNLLQPQNFKQARPSRGGGSRVPHEALHVLLASMREEMGGTLGPCQVSGSFSGVEGAAYPGTVAVPTVPPSSGAPAAVSLGAVAASIGAVVSPSGMIVLVAPAVLMWPSLFFKCRATAVLFTKLPKPILTSGVQAAK